MKSNCETFTGAAASCTLGNCWGWLGTSHFFFNQAKCYVSFRHICMDGHAKKHQFFFLPCSLVISCTRHIFSRTGDIRTMIFWSSPLGAQAQTRTDAFSFQVFLGSLYRCGCIATCVLLMQLLKNIPMPSALLWGYFTYHILFAKMFHLFVWCQCDYKWMQWTEVEHISCDWSNVFVLL